MLPHKPNAPIRLLYAKDFTDEWVLLTADTDHQVRGVLRTAGWAALCDHPISTEGLDDKEWRWAEWNGLYDPETEIFTGEWEEGFMRVVAAVGGPPVPPPAKFTPEAIQKWAAKCREKYEAKRGGYLLRSAFRLWLNAAGHPRKYVTWVTEQIPEDPKMEVVEDG